MVVNPRKPARPRNADPKDWLSLSEETQLRIATAALRRATARLVAQAEGMAEMYDEGGLSDRGGADALRLLARLLRLETEEKAAGASPGGAETAGSAWPAGFAPVGHA